MKVTSTHWDDKMKTELGQLFWVGLRIERTRYEAMLYASRRYHQEHPEVSSTAAYKELCRADAWRDA